jgi:hypothetical protein
MPSVAVAWLLLVLVWAIAARAEETPASPEGRGARERLEKALEAEPGLSPEVKRALLEALDELEAGQPPPQSLASSVLEKLQLYGDLRLRHETDFERAGRPSRNRERLRLRFGANYQVWRDLQAGARLSTGDPSDPRSPHQTLGETFDRFEVNLDRAFAAYRPEFIPGLSLSGGKFAHPFYQNPTYPELVWDADVQPTGAAGACEVTELFSEPSWLERLSVVAGEYLVEEQPLSGDAAAFVAQAAARVRVAEGLQSTAAAGYYLYGDLTPGGSADLFSENAGNATRDRNGDGAADDFLSRFEIFNPILALTYDGWALPVTISGEYIHNYRAAGGKGQGYAVGAALGGAEKQGDFRVYYQWQAIEQDAVLSLFAQDDFLRATNYRGHLAGVMVQLLDAVGLHLWFLVTHAEDRAPPVGSHHEWRLRADLNVKF